MTKNAHFSPRLFAFLAELKAHNNREWFQANKERYENDVRDPFLRLIADLGPGLKTINPHIVADPSPTRGSMMRIHRDVRFSKDKSPYKTAVAAGFSHGKAKDGAAPGYYLHLAPKGSLVGAGLWRPDPPALKKVRDAIVADPARWKRTTSARVLASGLSMGGESLKRAPVGYDPEHPLIQDLKRKDFVMGAPATDRDVCRNDFLDVVIDHFRRSAPFVQFLSEAVGLR